MAYIFKAKLYIWQYRNLYLIHGFVRIYTELTIRRNSSTQSVGE